MILGTFCEYFKRCFAHCVRPPTCSFDASGQRFSFILVPFPAYFPYVLYMFRKVFCMPCAISFDLFQNRLDLDLVLRWSIGEACSIRRAIHRMAARGDSKLLISGDAPEESKNYFVLRSFEEHHTKHLRALRP